MKSSILILLTLITLVSCGEKGESAKTNFKLKLGATVTNPAAFSGGMLITGRRSDGSQKFTLALTDDLELNLQKGAWEFATIAWPVPEGGKKMTGPQSCSYQQVEVRDDNQTITFNMNQNNCSGISNNMPVDFSSSQFYTLLPTASSTLGFKKLVLTECFSIDITTGSCSNTSASSTFQSYKIIIPSVIEGIQVANSAELSQCETMSYGTSYSNFRLPLGGPNGFIRTNIKMFQNPNCTESASSTSAYSYSKGFGNAVNGYSMLSPNFNSAYSNTQFNIVGSWSGGGIIPIVGRVRGDLLLISATSTAVPVIYPGDYAFFDGSTFQGLSQASFSVINGKIYFSEDYANFFIKPL